MKYKVNKKQLLQKQITWERKCNKIDNMSRETTTEAEGFTLTPLRIHYLRQGQKKRN